MFKGCVCFVYVNRVRLISFHVSKCIVMVWVDFQLQFYCLVDSYIFTFNFFFVKPVVDIFFVCVISSAFALVEVGSSSLVALLLVRMAKTVASSKFRIYSSFEGSSGSLWRRSLGRASELCVCVPGGECSLIRAEKAEGANVLVFL